MAFYKNLKYHTKMIIGFTLSFIVFITLFGSMMYGAKQLSVAENPTEYYRSIVTNGIIGIVLCTTVLYFFCITLTRKVRISFAGMTDAAERLAKGDTDVNIEIEATDEFGHICELINILAATQREDAEVAKKVADGDLTVVVTPKSEEDMLGKALRQMVESNHNALSSINDGAYQVMTSASQVASASESLAQGSTQQASAIEQVTASIAEVAEKTRQNAEEANQAASMVGTVIADVKAGNEQMTEMLNAMEDINKSSESISRIIKVIDDIAFQTNILALNAAVEAARAGDAGKGFAVVAEEVRNLAAKSAQAAAETAELIEDSISKVNVGSNMANETYKSLEVISEVVTKSESLITGIADSSNYQATAVAQINQAIGQISQVVQTNSATSEECAAASDDLSRQAARMRESLLVYNLGNSRTYAAATAAPTPVFTKKTVASSQNNEKIISLGDDFGKY